MLRRGAVVALGALAALALSNPGTQVKRELNVSAGVDINLDEDPEIGVDVALGLGHHPKDPPEPTYPEDPGTVTVTETKTEVSTTTDVSTTTITEAAETITQVITSTITTTETQAAETVTQVTTSTQTITDDGGTVTRTRTDVETETQERKSYSVTVTISETIVTTQLTTEYSTITSTQVSSVPYTVTREGPPVTDPGPGQSITAEPPTATITEISACPAPTNDFSTAEEASFDPSSDLTWGCAPGFICSPPKPQGCNFWADSPADSFVCAPEDCIRAPPYYRVDWPQNETEWYPPTEGYFNLDPHAFGLSFDIFEPPEEVVKTVHGKETTILTGNYASQTDVTHYPLPSTSAAGGDYERREVLAMRHGLKGRALFKRDNSVYPSICYAQCQNTYSESQKTGKSDKLCESGSQFLKNLASCTACVADYDEETPSNERTYLDDKFEQFASFCDGSDAEPTRGGGDDNSGGPESQVTTSEEVTTRSQEGGNTESGAQPITSETEVTSGGGATKTGGGPSPSETAGETGGDGENSPAPTPTSTSGTGGGGSSDDDGSNGDSGSGGSNDGSDSDSGSGSGSGPGSDSSGSNDDDSSSGLPPPDSTSGSGESGSTPGDDDGSGTGDSPPDETSGDSPGAGASSFPGQVATFLPLVGGLLFLL